MHTKQVLLGRRDEGWGQSLGAHPLPAMVLNSQPPQCRDKWGQQIVPTGQRSWATGHQLAHLNIDEDDLDVLRFEEPLQGLHEVLWGGERRMKEDETPPSSLGSERQGQGDRDRKRQANGGRGREMQRERVGECPHNSLDMTVHSRIIHNSTRVETTHTPINR